MAAPTADSEKARAEAMGIFGKVAIKLGYITAAQLEEAVKIQTASQLAGFRRHLGDILIRKGYLTEEQLRRILKSQTVSRRIGDYELISKLGAGAMGAVYKARQVSMDREVALKILSPKKARNEEFRERFLREARAVAKLNHPHIVSGIDVGEADGLWYFAMEYVDGDSLGQYLDRLGGPLPEAEALEYGRQIALALQHAHNHNILHRDVKPDNILLDKSGKTAKLVDLGLARAADVGDDEAGISKAGETVGTPFYMSPEQARGKRDLGPATDQYSLGATLFHLIGGQVPFDGPTAAVIMTRHLADPVPSPRAVNPAISLGADRLVMRLMQKAPEDRYPNSSHLIRDIERVQKGDTLDRVQSAVAPRKGKATAIGGGRPPSGLSSFNAPSRASRHVSSQRQAVGLRTALLLIALLGGLLAFLIYQNMRRAKPRASQPPASAPPAPPTKPAAAQRPDPRVPSAVPAFLRPQLDGRRAFRTDFEGKVENFDVAPQLLKASQYPAVVTDEAGKNHVLRLAPIGPPHRAAPNEEPAGVMARLLLPSDTVFSPNATLSLRVFFGQCADAEPELRIFWDHKIKTAGPDAVVGQVRSLACWRFKDPAFKTGWVRVELQLNKSQDCMKSTQLPDAVQYLSFTAGKPDENLEVYIDDLELADGGALAEGIAPPPAQGPNKEPPVVPPPKKALPKPAKEGALHRAL